MLAGHAVLGASAARLLLRVISFVVGHKSSGGGGGGEGGCLKREDKEVGCTVMALVAESKVSWTWI